MVFVFRVCAFVSLVTFRLQSDESCWCCTSMYDDAYVSVCVCVYTCLCVPVPVHVCKSRSDQTLQTRLEERHCQLDSLRKTLHANVKCESIHISHPHSRGTLHIHMQRLVRWLEEDTYPQHICVCML